MRARSALAAGLGVGLLLVASMCPAQIPPQMNYQVMLTDDADQPLADQTVTMVFSLYDSESAGTELWTETQTPTTNSIGVVSVVMGSVTPVAFDFDQPLWLEVEVNGQTLSPRRALTAAPYAGHAAGADDSERLGGTEAHEYVLADELDGPGTVNDPSNPVDWNMLFDVPAGFADGTDDAGGGVASMQSSAVIDLPTDVVYTIAERDITVPAAGYVFVMGTAQVDFNNYYTPSGHHAHFAVSELDNAFSDHSQESSVMLWEGAPLGYYDYHVAVSGLFAVTPGTHTFYFNAKEIDGFCYVTAVQLTLMYFPAAYGTVDTDD